MGDLCVRRNQSRFLRSELPSSRPYLIFDSLFRPVDSGVAFLHDELLLGGFALSVSKLFFFRRLMSESLDEVLTTSARKLRNFVLAFSTCLVELLISLVRWKSFHRMWRCVAESCH